MISELEQRLTRIEVMVTLAAKNVLNIDDVALISGYSKGYLRLMISKHEIPYYKRGARVFFDRGEIENWMRDTRYPTNDEIKALV